MPKLLSPLVLRRLLPFWCGLAGVLGCGEAAETVPAASEPTLWSSYGGDPGGSRYSALAEITAENVDSLEVAWAYRTGDYAELRPELGKTAFQATPIFDGETLYLCTPANRVIALDAQTGAERWTFEPPVDFRSTWARVCRGVALWTDDASDEAPCARRVFLGTLDMRLWAIDARTGHACTDFGEAGVVDLKRGLGEMWDGETYMTSPPTVIRDVVVTGSLVADNQRVDPPGGVIRGFDVRTGRMRWAFDPVPPGTPALPPGPDGGPRFHRGTPNAWSILSADPERGLVFVPFGGPSPDYFGGHRKGFDYYGSSTVALDADTGKVRWRFQTVHHDLWDYDVTGQPMLIDVQKDGRRVPAVAQATKMGHIFLLHRETGVPLYPVVERPVPQTTVPGEYTSPTQPFPTFPEPIHPHTLDADEIFGITPIDRALCHAKLRGVRAEGMFTPPSLQGSLHYPASAGGVNWGSMAWDPGRNLLVMNQARLAQITTLIPKESLPEASRNNRPSGLSLHEGTPYFVRNDVFASPLGIPCSPLPWGTLLAVDLSTGKKRWEIPFGTTEDLVPLFPIAMEFGLPSMGGPLAIASGLVFIGASMDDYLRVYDTSTGELRFEYRLPAGGQATPMTYRAGQGGRQFVVIAAGGHGTLGTTAGDYVMAFALPE
jgi:quinoprotein glucose dehydrogenase